jgi:glutamyl-tRNA reductase
LHGSLAACRLLLVGTDDIGILLAEQFRAAGLGREIKGNGITVATPVPRRAEILAQRLEGHFVLIEELDQALVMADIVITALSTGRHLLHPDRLRALRRARRHRPMLILDGGIPADVDPAVGKLDGFFVYDLADLERLALDGRFRREAETVEAWRLVEEEVERFLRRQAGRRTDPTVRALRQHFESVRQGVLARHAEAGASEATRLLINRLLHQPCAVLSAEGDASRADLLRHLFGLDETRANREEEETDGLDDGPELESEP